MSIFKNSFTPAVRNQLTARGQAFTRRNSSDLIYINGRAAWVRMISGVDIDGYGDKLAKENILQGGVLQTNGKSLRSGVGNNFNTNSYSNVTNGPLGIQSNLHGLVPMPGITSVNVESRSAYGSIRVATVNFICNDIKQLELMELLYMRPGFLVLLEWGWAPYLKNNGNLNFNPSLYDDMFKNNNKSLQERLIDVYNKSVLNDANYEGILGYVKNYSWSARPNGGYDCVTEIISTGEILESLKVNYSVNFLPSEQLRGGLLFKTASKYSDNIEKLYKTNIIAGIAGELIFKAYSVIGVTSTIKNESKAAISGLLLPYLALSKYSIIKDYDDTWEEGMSFKISDSQGDITGIPNSEINLFGLDINPESNKNNNEIESDKQVYIDLHSFINILNKWVIPVDKNNNSPIVSISLKDRNYIENNTNDLLCLYHPLQISMDPSICLIKNTKIKNIKNIKIERQNITSTFEPQNIYTDNKNKQLLSYVFKNTVNSMLSELGNENDLDKRISIIKVYITSMIKNAELKGINKNDATEIIANVWENYKFISSFSLRNEKFVINSDAVNTLYESDDKNKTAELSFLDMLRYNLTFGLFGSNLEIFQNNPDNSLKEALGNDYKLFFKSNDIVRNFSISQIKEKFNILENDELTQSLQFDAIKFLDKLKLNYEYNDSGFGVIGNIYVNLNNILNIAIGSELEANDIKEKREINLYDFLKKLMNQIQGSIGSINNFEIHVDPIDNIARIIDINYIDLKNTNEAYKNAYTFLSQTPTEFNPKLDSLFNNIRSYKINSKIFKEQSSIVAISAQNGGGVMGLDNETLVGFNKGIKNRLIPNSNPRILYDYSKEIKQSELINNINSSLSILYNFLEDLNWIENKYIIFDKSRKYKFENSEQYKNILRDFISNYQSISTTPSSFRSIIPTTVSLELDGIGGLIIGHMFRLPSELLPMGYKTLNGIGRKQGYIITKLGHRVSDSDWVTNVEAQTIILEDNLNNQKFNLNEALEAAQRGTQVTIKPDGQLNIEEQNINQVTKGTSINENKRNVVEAIIKYSKSKGINDPQRLTAILTVALAESSLIPTKVEELIYSVDRAKAVFPSRLAGKTNTEIAKIFSSTESAGEFLYGGRFGNNQPGDGAKYRGRGLTQITFKDNYVKMRDNLKKAGENIDIVSNPELANQFDNSIKILIIGKLYSQFGAQLKPGVNYKNSAHEIIRTQNGNQTPNNEILQVYTKALASINSTNWIQDLLKYENT
jgi:predicted chitinase